MMRKYSTLCAVASALILAMSQSQALAGDKLGDFVNAISPGQLTNPGGPFEGSTPNNLEYLGAKVLVKVGDEVKIIEFVPSSGDVVGTDLGNGFNNPGESVPWPAAGGGGGGGGSVQMTTLAVAQPAPSECVPPILEIGQEYYYQIRWCEEQANQAKKNYWYRFSNGDIALVLSVLYDCTDPNDYVAMPTTVSSTVCQ